MVRKDIVRWSKNGNDFLRGKMDEYAQNISSAFLATKKISHSTIKGDGRAKAIADGLRMHLPETFGIAYNSFSIDYQWNQSWELDLIIYNKISNSPFHGNSWKNDKWLTLPIEAILAVIEVKSTINSSEYKKVEDSLTKLYKLKPWKKKLGITSSEEWCRIFYTLFAFETNLTRQGEAWLKSEYSRIPIKDNTRKKITRLIVTGKWIINPWDMRGKLATDNLSSGNIILEWYINLANFLNRENKRREPVDLENYMNTLWRWWFKVSDEAIDRYKKKG